MKGYLFDTIGIAVVILAILFSFYFFTAGTSYFVEHAPDNTTNETYTLITESFVSAQSSFPLIFAIMYVVIVLASSTVNIHPGVLVISGIMLIFSMILISVFEDTFSTFLAYIPSELITTEFSNVISDFKLFSILTGISVLFVGMIKTAKTM